MYGSGEGYQERVMLIYDGLHYDALALAGGTPVVVLFSVKVFQNHLYCTQFLKIMYLQFSSF